MKNNTIFSTLAETRHSDSFSMGLLFSILVWLFAEREIGVQRNFGKKLCRELLEETGMKTRQMLQILE